MLSLIVLLLLIFILIIIFNISKNRIYLYLFLIVFVVFIIESVVFLYLVYLIHTGDCLFLINQQKGLDALIKMRLSYSTYFAQGKKTFFYAVDQTLGYTVGSDKDTTVYQSNNQGFRANKNYPLLPAGDTLRMAAFGDSFVFCDDEKNKDSWPFILEHSVKNLDVLNFGVGGYGLGQSYLRYLKDGIKYSPDIVFFNYILFSDRDVVNPKDIVSADNLRMAYLYRVIFEEKNGVLTTKPLSPYDFFQPDFLDKYIYQPLGFSPQGFLTSPWVSFFNTGVLLKNIYIKKSLSHKTIPDNYFSEETLNLKILENLLKETQKQQSSLLFFYARPYDSLPNKVRELLARFGNHVVYVDSQKALNDIYERNNIKDHKSLLNKTNHYNAKGNQFYAQAVLEILKDHSWGQGSRRFQFDAGKNSFIKIKADATF